MKKFIILIMTLSMYCWLTAQESVTRTDSLEFNLFIRSLPELELPIFTLPEPQTPEITDTNFMKNYFFVFEEEFSPDQQCNHGYALGKALVKDKIFVFYWIDGCAGGDNQSDYLVIYDWNGNKIDMLVTGFGNADWGNENYQYGKVYADSITIVLTVSEREGDENGEEGEMVLKHREDIKYLIGPDGKIRMEFRTINRSYTIRDSLLYIKNRLIYNCRNKIEEVFPELDRVYLIVSQKLPGKENDCSIDLHSVTKQGKLLWKTGLFSEATDFRDHYISFTSGKKSLELHINYHSFAIDRKTGKFAEKQY